jgi:hypothetical protein
MVVEMNVIFVVLGWLWTREIRIDSLTRLRLVLSFLLCFGNYSPLTDEEVLNESCGIVFLSLFV